MHWQKQMTALKTLRRFGYNPKKGVLFMNTDVLIVGAGLIDNPAILSIT